MSHINTTTIKDTNQKAQLSNITISILLKNLSEDDFDNEKKVRYNMKIKYP